MENRKIWLVLLSLACALGVLGQCWNAFYEKRMGPVNTGLIIAWLVLFVSALWVYKTKKV